MLGFWALLGVGTAGKNRLALLELFLTALAQGLGLFFAVREAHEAPRLGIQVGGFFMGEPGALRNEKTGAQLASAVEAAQAVSAVVYAAKGKLVCSSAHRWPPVRAVSWCCAD